MPRALTTFSFTGLAALALVAPIAGAAADGLALRYDVYAGGTFAVAMEAELQITPTSYRLGAALELGGVYAVVSSWDMQTSASGVIAGQHVLPVSFNKVSEDGERWAELRFSDGTLVDAQGNPSPALEDTSAVSDAIKAAALDPLGGVISVLVQVAETGSCAGSMVLYDGKSYFTVTRTDLGAATAPDSRYGAYAGPALLCRVVIDDAVAYGRIDDEPSVALAWLAQPVAGGPYVPVRLETDSKFGAVRVHITDFWPVAGETPQWQ